jgi:hypothetical protein
MLFINDWKKVLHIPNIYKNGVLIQSEKTHIRAQQTNAGRKNRMAHTDSVINSARVCVPRGSLPTVCEKENEYSFFSGRFTQPHWHLSLIPSTTRWVPKLRIHTIPDVCAGGFLWMNSASVCANLTRLWLVYDSENKCSCLSKCVCLFEIVWDRTQCSFLNSS